MTDSDLAVISRDIRALSVFLYIGSSYWWPPINQPEDEKTKFFSHIAALLDLNANLPVAVTGTVTRENVTATIVCSMTVEQKLEQQLMGYSHVEPSRRSLEEILDDKSTPPDIKGYIADLMALFGAVENQIGRDKIIEWVIHRSWSMLCIRFERSKTDFQGDLFDNIEAWSPDRYDEVPQHEVSMPKNSSVYSKYPSIASRTDQATTFTLNEDTAPLLAATIARIFKEIRQTLEDPDVDHAEAASKLVDSFVWLHVMLWNKHVEALLTDTSLRFSLVPKWPESYADEPTDGWEPLPGHQSMREIFYGLRYMRMLVACATSVLRLNASKVRPLFATADITIVPLVTPATRDVESECRSVAQEVSDAVERGPTEDQGWKTAACKWILRRANVVASVSGGQEASARRLHTEAGLMASICEERLARDGAHGGDEEPLDLTRAPLGVSGTCCPLCLRLAQLLNAHLSSLGSPGTRGVFPHIATHGRVLPWDPPQFGIPKPVLVKLRDELRDRFIQRALAITKPRVPEVDASDRKEPVDFLWMQAQGG